MGEIESLPIGITFFGRPYTEPLLIGYAHALEQELAAWREPEFLPTVGAVRREEVGE